MIDNFYFDILKDLEGDILKMNFKKIKLQLVSLIVCVGVAMSCVMSAGAEGEEQQLSIEGYQPDFEVTADAVYMVNLDTGKVVYEKNAHKKIYPASTTKIMTAALVLENVEDLEQTVTAKAYLYDEFAGLNVSTGDIRAGQTLTVNQLLYGTMLQSANEGANILADFVGDGSITKFCQMMTEKAKELGCENTNFVNPHGLYNENHYTTAYDMYLITKYAMSIPGFMDYVTVPVYDVGKTDFHDYLKWITTNKMMIEGSEYYYEPIRGIKTGTLDEAGKCFISSATKDGYNYLLVLMGAPMYDEDGNYIEENTAFELTEQLYEWAFDTFQIKTVMEEGKSVHDVPLKLCWGKDTLNLVSAEDFTALIPSDYDITSVQGVADVPNFVKAPIEKGEEIGRMKLMLSNEEIGSVSLVAGESVEANPILTVIYYVETVVKTFWFKWLATFAVVLFGIYMIVCAVRRRNMRKYNRIKRK